METGGDQLTENQAIENDRITNRHVGKVLRKLEQIHDLSDFAKEGIRSEMHYLKEDLVESMEDNYNEKGYNK